MPLLSLLLPLILLGFILYLVQLIPMQATVKQIIVAVAILAIVLWVLSVLLGIGPGVAWR